jgi:hypothetical protein
MDLRFPITHLPSQVWPAKTPDYYAFKSQHVFCTSLVIQPVVLGWTREKPISGVDVYYRVDAQADLPAELCPFPSRQHTPPEWVPLVYGKWLYVVETPEGVHQLSIYDLNRCFHFTTNDLLAAFLVNNSNTIPNSKVLIPRIPPALYVFALTHRSVDFLHNAANEIRRNPRLVRPYTAIWPSDKPAPPTLVDIVFSQPTEQEAWLSAVAVAFAAIHARIARQ